MPGLPSNRAAESSMEQKAWSVLRTGLINHRHRLAERMSPALLAGLIVDEMRPTLFMRPVVVKSTPSLRGLEHIAGRHA
jgi:hypothetical protein